MRALVTGGAGFIGSHLCERLQRDGHEVLIFDDLNDFYSPRLKEENLAAVLSLGRAQFHKCDICERQEVLPLVERFAPDTVIHLAARAGVRPSLQEPFLYERVNVMGTMVLLEAARLAGVKRFIFASSSSVYGIASRVPFSEDDRLDHPASPYAATKIAGEKLCRVWSHLYGLSVVCLRFFTVYGPRQRPDLAIRKFVERIERGEPIQVFGDGSSARDYTFIDDIVDGITRSLDIGEPYSVFNLGNSRPIPLLQLIRTIEEALGQRADLHWLPDQPGDVPITFADITKAQRVLDYCPRTPLEQGIARFLSWRRAKAPQEPHRT